ncbi:hypothetical protein D9613_010354 [Agrocybe pediades]|uniref:Uncharacterized protein n=1 Tax=Agrocybe pediades TaxID=84607 RepID=A0A8H4QGJ3_9AGAR|nr:hypothetical protein D9613_010354 [Agrocybe pediades]
MADPLSISLAVITLATALKDLTELALKLRDSFRNHPRNMRIAHSLAAETLEIVQDLDKYYQSHRDALDKMPEVRDAVIALSKDMKSVHDKCLPFFQVETSPPKGLRKTILLIELWMKRKELESNICDLKEQANRCYRRFTVCTTLDVTTKSGPDEHRAFAFQTHTQLGTVIAIGELKGAVTEGFVATGRQLSTLQVSDENVLAFMGSTRAALSALPPGVTLSEDLVFKLYIRGHVHKIDNILRDLASKHSYALEEPDARHSRPFSVRSSISLNTPAEVEYMRAKVVTDLIRVQHDLLDVEAGGTPTQEGAWPLNTLSVALDGLGMFSESLVLCTWSVDLYKTLSKSARDVYAPHLALALYNLSYSSFNSGDFARAIVTAAECLALLKISVSTTQMIQLTAEMLSQSARHRRAIDEDPSGALKDAQDSVAMFECLGANEIDESGANAVVLDYANALDVQRRCLYDSQRYQEALDAGEEALGLRRRLAQSYEDVGNQYQIACICIFLCSDAFRDILPLSSALKYAEEAERGFEKVQEIIRAEEDIPYCLEQKTKILMEMGRSGDALAVYQKLARRVRFMATNQWMYLPMLQDLSSDLFELGHYFEAATMSRTIVEISRQSSDTLLPAPRFDILLHHAQNCDMADCLSDALTCSREALVVAKFQRVKDASFTKQYLFCVQTAAHMSLDAGYPDEAINHCQRSLNNISSLSAYNQEILYLICIEALAFLRLGQLSLATATLNRGYDFTESLTLNFQKDVRYGKLLFTSALVYRCKGMQEDALTAIKAAVPIFESANWNPQLYMLSDLQADMGYDAEGLDTAEGAMRSTEHCTSLPPSIAFWHKNSQYSLCLRLFFNGDFTRARKLILEVRAFYKWHSHSRNAWFVNLACAIRAEGILECASDRHAEGAAARTRLEELQRRLRATLSGVAEQVEVGLNYERNFPAWKRLLEKYPLTCSHWSEESSNEEQQSGQEFDQESYQESYQELDQESDKESDQESES